LNVAWDQIDRRIQAIWTLGHAHKGIQPCIVVGVAGRLERQVHLGIAGSERHVPSRALSALVRVVD
jgi:hypothetical protein